VNLLERHLKSTEKGVIGCLLRVLYCSYRLGMNSVEVSQEFGLVVSPTHVRQTLYRLNLLAAELFPEVAQERKDVQVRLQQERYDRKHNQPLQVWQDDFRDPSRREKSAMPTFHSILGWATANDSSLPETAKDRATLWDAMRCDELDSIHVAASLFLFAAHEGVREAVKLLQTVVGARPDGTMSDATIAAISSDNPRNVVRALRRAMESYYQQRVARDPSKKPFLAQWLTRASLAYSG
jgi:hypothetical protein